MYLFYFIFYKRQIQLVHSIKFIALISIFIELLIWQHYNKQIQELAKAQQAQQYNNTIPMEPNQNTNRYAENQNKGQQQQQQQHLYQNSSEQYGDDQVRYVDLNDIQENQKQGQIIEKTNKFDSSIDITKKKKQEVLSGDQKGNGLMIYSSTTLNKNSKKEYLHPYNPQNKDLVMSKSKVKKQKTGNSQKNYPQQKQQQQKNIDQIDQNFSSIKSQFNQTKSRQSTKEQQKMKKNDDNISTSSASNQFKKTNSKTSLLRESYNAKAQQNYQQEINLENLNFYKNLTDRRQNQFSQELINVFYFQNKQISQVIQQNMQGIKKIVYDKEGTKLFIKSLQALKTVLLLQNVIIRLICGVKQIKDAMQMENSDKIVEIYIFEERTNIQFDLKRRYPKITKIITNKNEISRLIKETLAILHEDLDLISQNPAFQIIKHNFSQLINKAVLFIGALKLQFTQEKHFKQKTLNFCRTLNQYQQNTKGFKASVDKFQNQFQNQFLPKNYLQHKEFFKMIMWNVKNIKQNKQFQNYVLIISQLYHFIKKFDDRTKPQSQMKEMQYYQSTFQDNLLKKDFKFKDKIQGLQKNSTFHYCFVNMKNIQIESYYKNCFIQNFGFVETQESIVNQYQEFQKVKPANQLTHAPVLFIIQCSKQKRDYSECDHGFSKLSNNKTLFNILNIFHIIDKSSITYQNQEFTVIHLKYGELLKNNKEAGYRDIYPQAFSYNLSLQSIFDAIEDQGDVYMKQDNKEAALKQYERKYNQTDDFCQKRRYQQKIDMCNLHNHQFKQAQLRQKSNQIQLKVHQDCAKQALKNSDHASTLQNLEQSINILKSQKTDTFEKLIKLIQTLREKGKALFKLGEIIWAKQAFLQSLNIIQNNQRPLLEQMEKIKQNIQLSIFQRFFGCGNDTQTPQRIINRKKLARILRQLQILKLNKTKIITNFNLTIGQLKNLAQLTGNPKQLKYYTNTQLEYFKNIKKNPLQNKQVSMSIQIQSAIATISEDFDKTVKVFQKGKKYYFQQRFDSEQYKNVTILLGKSNKSKLKQIQIPSQNLNKGQKMEYDPKRIQKLFQNSKINLQEAIELHLFFNNGDRTDSQLLNLSNQLSELLLQRELLVPSLTSLTNMIQNARLQNPTFIHEEIIKAKVMIMQIHKKRGSTILVIQQINPIRDIFSQLKIINGFDPKQNYDNKLFSGLWQKFILMEIEAVSKKGNTLQQKKQAFRKLQQQYSKIERNIYQNKRQLYEFLPTVSYQIGLLQQKQTNVIAQLKKTLDQLSRYGRQFDFIKANVLTHLSATLPKEQKYKNQLNEVLFSYSLEHPILFRKFILQKDYKSCLNLISHYDETAFVKLNINFLLLQSEWVKLRKQGKNELEIQGNIHQLREKIILQIEITKHKLNPLRETYTEKDDDKVSLLKQIDDFILSMIVIRGGNIGAMNRRQ